MDENRITYFAETDARNKKVKFGIKAKDRTRHVYVIGKTGMGKSCLLENMAVQDIQSGEGICFIDPHGKTADLLLEYVPKERIKDVILIAPFDTEFPISFNVLESVDPEKRHLVVSGLMSTFKKIWVDAWSARMEYILTNTLLALLEAPGSTLLGVNKMLSDKEYRKEIVSHVKDPSVKTFWNKEFANYTERQAAEAVPSIQNKVGQFTANPLIRNMIGQPVSSFDFREAMDSRKIMIINLSKGRIGDENMKLLGGLLVTKIYLAAMSRADVPDRVLKTLPNFYLHVDEFQNFANASFADILSEARKYKLNLTIAHQYVEQMDEVVRPAIFGNVGTMIVFRVGATDAEFLEKEFAPQFEIEDLVNLGFAQIYLKLMIDGLTSSPFSATTIPPIVHPDVSFVKEIIESSRAQFSHPRAQVEEAIVKFHDPAPKPAAPKPVAPKAPVSAPSASAPAMPASSTTSKPVVSNVSVNNASPAPSTPSYNSPKPFSPAKPATAPSSATSSPTVKPSASSTPQSSPIKPVPLSSLAQSPRPASANQARPDPKVQSPKNVNDLKSALAAALSKSQPKPAPASTATSSTTSSNVMPPKASQPNDDGFKSLGSLKDLKNIPMVQKPPVKPVTPAAITKPAQPAPSSTAQGTATPAPAQIPTQPQAASAPQKESSKEVPEDVLAKVLKVE